MVSRSESERIPKTRIDTLYKMAGAVGPRASKEEFMHALGLDANNPQHEYYYKAMRVSLCRKKFRKTNSEKYAMAERK